MAGELEKLLMQFARQRGLNMPERDGNHRYFMLFDGDIEVALFQSGETIYLQGQIDSIPAERQQAEDLLERTLRLQLARLRQHREIVCIDAEENNLVLFRMLAARRLNPVELEKALEIFVNALEFWTGETLRPVPRHAPPPQLRMLFP